MEVGFPHKLSYASSLLRAGVCHLHQCLSERQPPPGDVNRAPSIQIKQVSLTNCHPLLKKRRQRQFNQPLQS